MVPNLRHVAKVRRLAAQSTKFLGEEVDFVLVLAAGLHARVLDVDELERELEQEVFKLIATELEDLFKSARHFGTWCISSVHIFMFFFVVRLHSKYFICHCTDSAMFCTLKPLCSTHSSFFSPLRACCCLRSCFGFTALLIEILYIVASWRYISSRSLIARYYSSNARQSGGQLSLSPLYFI
jgi:hypothetical protein